MIVTRLMQVNSIIELQTLEWKAENIRGIDSNLMHGTDHSSCMQGSWLMLYVPL